MPDLTPLIAATPRPDRPALVIVEGLFLHRDELLRRWDLSVFLDVPAEVPVRRMAERDGTSPDPEDPRSRGTCMDSGSTSPAAARTSGRRT